MAHCEDCGTKLSNDICPYCEEELLIIVTQGADMDRPLSEEFSAKVDEQQEKVRQRVALRRKP